MSEKKGLDKYSILVISFILFAITISRITEKALSPAEHGAVLTLSWVTSILALTFGFGVLRKHKMQ